MDVRLRAVEPADVPLLFAFQADPVAAAMAAFPSRDREAYEAHLAKLEADPDVINLVIEADGVAVGSIGSFTYEGQREVAYWVDRAQWGRGIASTALGLLLELDPVRPLHAGTAPDNVASQRVLAHLGFAPDGTADSDGMLMFRLDA